MLMSQTNLVQVPLTTVLYLMKLLDVLAILRETSGGTSYLMVRLVFRPYTQI